MLRLRPCLGHQIFDLPVGHRGQAGEHVPEIGERVEDTPPATFDDGVDDRAAHAGLGLADEEPVLLADGGRADGVFDEIVVDLQAAIFEEEEQRGPLVQGVVDGLAHEAAGQEVPLT